MASPLAAYYLVRCFWLSTALLLEASLPRPLLTLLWYSAGHNGLSPDPDTDRQEMDFLHSCGLQHPGTRFYRAPGRVNIID